MPTKNIIEQIKKLPTHPGVYLFLDNNEEILYIGKAINIKKRVQSHFTSKNSDRPISMKLYQRVRRIDYISTKTEKSALLLEQRLVKLHQPKYNIELKDDKAYARVAITQEPAPQILVVRQTKNIHAELIGPFVESRELKSFLGKIRLLFPYRICKNKFEKPCLDHHLGLCPAHGTAIKKYPIFLQGIKALLHLYNGEKPIIECYDVSHTHGSNTSASMITFRGTHKHLAGYRLFNIRAKTNGDDPRSLREALERRLKHTEWPYPNLILIDGGRSQLSQLKHIPLPIIGIAKYNRESSQATLYTPYTNRSLELSSLPEIVAQTFLRMRDEAHRFAIKQQRSRSIRLLSTKQP